MYVVRRALIAALEVREHCKNAAVVAVGLRQPELGEDAGDVLLDLADGEHERLRNAGVRATLRHQGQNLELARRQVSETRVAPRHPDRPSR
jgi:hypothetical protein